MGRPRRAGIAYPCGRPAGPMLSRSARNRPRIPYRDARRSSSRILRRRRRSLVPCRFRCGPFRPAAVRRCGMPRRTRCAWNSRGRCMGARPIPILHMGNCAAVIYLGVPRSSGAGRSTRRGFRGRSRAGRIAGALGCSGIFAVLCRDNTGRGRSIGTKGRRFFLAACPSALLSCCRNLLGGMAGRSRLTGCACCGGILWRGHAALFACLSGRFSSRRRKHPAPTQGRPCWCRSLLRRSFGRSSCPRLAACLQLKQ